MSLVPADLLFKFQRSGWYRGRQVPVNAAVPIDHPSRRVLAEFGDLSLIRRYDDNGEIREVEFQYLAEKNELVLLWEVVLGTTLVGIAEHHNGHGELWMSGRGHVFGASIIHDAFWHVGSSFQDALENLMAGVQGRPMLLDTQTSVTLYGITYTHEDREVLRPSSTELRS